MIANVSIAEVKRLLDDGTQLVEVLGPDEYGPQHLPGAINIPLKTFSREAFPFSTVRGQSSSTATTSSET